MTRIYYYFVFAFRRFCRAGESNRGWGVQRANLLQILVGARIVFSLAWLTFPQIMHYGTTLGWSVILGGPVALATFFLNENHARYLHFAKEFQQLPRGGKFFADMGVVIVSIVGGLSPIIVRMILTGRPWWT